MEPQYVSILKNLRGVIYFSNEEEILEKIKWLNRHFRYRYIGISRSLFEKAKEKKIKKILNKKPFIRLFYPSENIKKFINRIIKITKENYFLTESLLLSSSYVSPLLILEEKALLQCKNFIIHSLEIQENLDDKELKRHLRIADYGVIDIHERTTHQALNGLREALHFLLKNEFSKGEKILKSLIENRKKLADNDCRTRYWRLISEKNKEGIKVVVYLDPCSMLFNSLKERKNIKEIAELMMNSEDEISITLGLVTGFFISI